MKRISSFIVKEVRKPEVCKIELSAKVDSESKEFELQIDETNKYLLSEMSRDLEFLLRANDVVLSKNLMKLLKDIIDEKEINLPFIVYSEKVKSRPRQPQAA